MTNLDPTPDAPLGRVMRSRPIPTAADFAPFDHSATDRTRNQQRGYRTTPRKRKFVL